MDYVAGRRPPGMDNDREFEARIGAGEVVFDAEDARLLRAVDEHESLNAATEALGRSFAHAQRRIVALEEAFGTLVERRRGGAGGGGSELTEGARDLLAAFARLRAEYARVARTEWTVVSGTVVARAGELLTVDTPLGELRALGRGVGEDTGGTETTLAGATAGEDADAGPVAVEVAIRADALTLTRSAPEPDDTSARNQFSGTVAGIDRGASVALVTVDVGSATLSALVTTDSLERLGLETGEDVVASLKATATRAIPRE